MVRRRMHSADPPVRAPVTPAIAQALEKSNLFVLTVTPHLLEHPNYVMSEEFPAAKNSDTPMLKKKRVASG